MQAGIEYIGIATPFYCHDGEGEILLHKRSQGCRDECGRWDPGSGKLEHGISIKENVRKEIREEYGCEGKIQNSLPAHDIFREEDGKETHWIAVPHFVRINRGDEQINEPEKMDDIGWFSLNELPDPLHTGFSHTLELYKDIFEECI